MRRFQGGAGARMLALDAECATATDFRAVRRTMSVPSRGGSPRTAGIERLPDPHATDFRGGRGIAATVLAAALFLCGCSRVSGTEEAPAAAPQRSGSHVSVTPPVGRRQAPQVELSLQQAKSINIAPVGTHTFTITKEAPGNIDFDGDLSVQVFPPYQGKILNTFAKLGGHVRKGQPLYSIDSPDLVQAESTLISTAGTFELTTKELNRVRELFARSGGISQKDYEQAVSDQQTAEGAFRAARDAVRIFGKTDAEIDRIAASRRVDPVLVVRSPISGQVTSKNSAPGLFVQPGTAPAPYAVADVSVKWMLANVIESDAPLFRAGQPVEVTVMAFPHRVFRGRVSKVYATVDPSTHRETIRSDIADPKNELRPGMLASFSIEVARPVTSIAIPENGVVREGDGTLTAWVTTDRHHFTQRVIKTGLRENGQVQILDGLRLGELVVTDGALFLDNMVNAVPSD